MAGRRSARHNAPPHARSERHLSAPVAVDSLSAVDAFVGRQPIFDAALSVYGYELLFRNGAQNTAAQVGGDHATARVLLSAFVDIGLERIVGHHLAFINMTRDHILDIERLALPKDRVVLEVLEDVAVDAALLTALSSLARDGYRIALDDFIYRPQLAPLVSLAQVIKIDVRALDQAEILRHVRELGRSGVKLLAEKVETREEFQHFRAMGFELFQGYFLSRPSLVTGKRLADNRLAILQLIAQLEDPDVTVAQVEAAVSRDVSLTYKLLRFINSAYFGLPEKIDSLRRAVVFLGFGPLKRWVTLMAMAGLSDQSSELARFALVRACMCEVLALRVGDDTSDSYFMAGLLSSLDALMNAPIGEILNKLPLSEVLHDAIARHGGRIGAALACVRAYERCEWDNARFEGLDVAAIREAYTSAVAWSFDASPALFGD